jgi:hypothetical protein
MTVLSGRSTPAAERFLTWRRRFTRRRAIGEEGRGAQGVAFWK